MQYILWLKAFDTPHWIPFNRLYWEWTSRSLYILFTRSCFVEMAKYAYLIKVTSPTFNNHLKDKYNLRLSLPQFKELSFERFEALVGYTRDPIMLFISEELEFWADSQERVIGAVNLDKLDNDFSIVLLGRDEIGRFRFIYGDASLPSILEARAALFHKIEEYAQKPDSAYYQLDVTRTGLELFTHLPDVNDSNCPAGFLMLRDSVNFSPARELISEIMPHYIDVDKNQFVKEFQTKGFDQRIWELYLFCFFNESCLKRHPEYQRPDFVLEASLIRDYWIGAEAVTIAKADNPENIPHYLEAKKDFNAYMRTRFSRALRRKLNHKPPYWQEEKIDNSPFCIAIADFHADGRLDKSGNILLPTAMVSNEALIEYLYGHSFSSTYNKNGEVTQANKLIKDEHAIKSGHAYGFFNEPNSENVSAVITSSHGTISKFNRMGKLAGFGSPKVRIIQNATIHNPDTTCPHPLTTTFHIIPGEHKEAWSTGLEVFHNPNALYPLDAKVLPLALHNFWQDGMLLKVPHDVEELPVIYKSVTHVTVEE